MRGFSRYAMARMEQDTIDTAYRTYVTDSIFYQAQNQRLAVRFADAMRREPQEKRTGNEIAADFIKRAGLVVADGSFSA